MTVAKMILNHLVMMMMIKYDVSSDDDDYIKKDDDSSEDDHVKKDDDSSEDDDTSDDGNTLSNDICTKSYSGYYDSKNDEVSDNSSSNNNSSNDNSSNSEEDDDDSTVSSHNEEHKQGFRTNNFLSVVYNEPGYGKKFRVRIRMKKDAEVYVSYK
ncbi:hypothetical protein RhiirC2_737712 [Rhizophagus irregularis]|uniref:Uncharacterized protein n=1 Tax=Rhizophagus irregularis TaxID=588596 RepID=A0A2N1NM14_9GLOM|nr:hypothetical protein RhiirC2_737712 [Rhizophagus irregularis]